MEKSNQHPKAEGCSAGTEPVDLWFYRKKGPPRSVPAVKCEPQAGPATCLSNSASKDLNASGEAVNAAEPSIDVTAKGEVMEGSPGSKSVARTEGDARNEGGPESNCRTHCEGQAGTGTQRQEAPSDTPGVGWVHRTGPPSPSSEAREGTPRETQPAQATGPVRTTEQDWQTFLRAIAEKAYTQKHYRFGGLYRMIHQDVLRLCFYRLRKDAASGVDQVTFQD